jgi:4-hydroxymandelate oxidase
MDKQNYINLKDYELQAQKLLPQAVWAYFSGAAADGLTARANIEAWQDIALVPRVLKNFRGSHTQSTLFNRRMPCPIFAAPMAYQRLAHPQGESALAMAAAVQGAGVILSTQTSTPMQEIAEIVLKEANRGPLWFQLYLQHDDAFNRKLIREIEASGFEAIVLTVDAPINGMRDNERRAGFQLPKDVSAVHLKDLPDLPVSQDPMNTVLDLMSHTPDWRSVEKLLSMTKLPVLLKGITHPQDALLAKKLKVKGIIVSNHGGRVLDTVAPTAQLLPGIVRAVKGSMPVLVDGGIRRGTDILKALALGASAVLVGRPLIYALACDGAYGVAHAVKLLRDEFEIAMALCGCKTIKDIDGAILFQE